MLDLVFFACSALVLPCWLLLAVAPTHRVTTLLVHSAVPGLVLGLVYVATFAAFLLGEGWPADGGFASLDGAVAVMARPIAVLIAFVHFMVFDLFVGAWQARDATRLGISRWVVLPCLLLTLVAGPSGLLLYLALRAALRRVTALEPEPELGVEPS